MLFPPAHVNRIYICRARKEWASEEDEASPPGSVVSFWFSDEDVEKATSPSSVPFFHDVIQVCFSLPLYVEFPFVERTIIAPHRKATLSSVVATCEFGRC